MCSPGAAQASLIEGCTGSHAAGAGRRLAAGQANGYHAGLAICQLESLQPGHLLQGCQHAVIKFQAPQLQVAQRDKRRQAAQASVGQLEKGEGGAMGGHPCKPCNQLPSDAIFSKRADHGERLQICQCRRLPGQIQGPRGFKGLDVQLQLLLLSPSAAAGTASPHYGHSGARSWWVDPIPAELGKCYSGKRSLPCPGWKATSRQMSRSWAGSTSGGAPPPVCTPKNGSMIRQHIEMHFNIERFCC